MADLFTQLLEFRWRDIGVPISETTLEVRQDLVIHKFADRNGAHVEGTGRHPLQFTARIPFMNGLTAAPGETWGGKQLYPTVWRAFFTACTDNTSGTLQHPELGPLTVKLEHCKTVWSATRRGGVDVEASWIESDDDGADLLAALSSPSPIAGLMSSAADIDSQLAQFAANPDAGLSDVYAPDESFSSYVASVVAVSDTQSLLGQASAGQCDVIVAQALAVQATLGGSCLTWSLNLSCDIAIENARNAKAAILSQGKPVSLFTVGKDCTMGELAAVIPANVTDLIRLNLTLVQNPIVPQGTVVQYYALPAAAP